MEGRFTQFLTSLQESALGDLQVMPILLNLALVLILGQVLAWHYRKFSPVLSNKRKFSRMFVFLAATTMLVISVVKTSLALSLGLVGALSIIRFRTPIKEPEELAYLFLSVALGIGLGADQRIGTVLMFLVILAYLGITSMGKGAVLPARQLVHVTFELGDDDQKGDAVLLRLLEEVEAESLQVDLRRVDVANQTFNAVLALDLERKEKVASLLASIRTSLPGASVSVVDGSSLD